MHLDLWTLALQALNLGVLLVLLRWLFYRPLLGVIERRRRAAEDTLAQAEKARQQAQAEAERLASERRALQVERDGVLAQAKHEAAQAGEAARQLAKQATERSLADGRAQLARERAEAERQLGAQAAAAAGEMARRLLAQLPAPAARRVGDAFVDAALDAVDASPEATRAHWFDVGGEPPRVRVASAAALSDDQAARLRRRLHAAMGDTLQIDLVSDPALLAGLALQFPHATLASHWAGALDALQADLRRATESAAATAAGTAAGTAAKTAAKTAAEKPVEVAADPAAGVASAPAPHVGSPPMADGHDDG